MPEKILGDAELLQGIKDYHEQLKGEELKDDPLRRDVSFLPSNLEKCVSRVIVYRLLALEDTIRRKKGTISRSPSVDNFIEEVLEMEDEE